METLFEKGVNKILLQKFFFLEKLNTKKKKKMRFQSNKTLFLKQKNKYMFAYCLIK